MALPYTSNAEASVNAALVYGNNIDMTTLIREDAMLAQLKRPFAPMVVDGNSLGQVTYVSQAVPVFGEMIDTVMPRDTYKSNFIGIQEVHLEKHKFQLNCMENELLYWNTSYNLEEKMRLVVENQAIASAYTMFALALNSLFNVKYDANANVWDTTIDRTNKVLELSAFLETLSIVGEDYSKYFDYFGGHGFDNLVLVMDEATAGAIGHAIRKEIGYSDPLVTKIGGMAAGNMELIQSRLPNGFEVCVIPRKLMKYHSHYFKGGNELLGKIYITPVAQIRGAITNKLLMNKQIVQQAGTNMEYYIEAGYANIADTLTVERDGQAAVDGIVRNSGLINVTITN